MEKRLSRQEIFILPAPLSNFSSRNSSLCNPIIASTSRNSSKLMAISPGLISQKFPVKKSKHNVLISKSTQASKIGNSCNAVKSSEDCKDEAEHHARSLPRSKQSVLSKARLVPTSRSPSNSEVNISRSTTYHDQTATSDTLKISHNCASSLYETVKPQAVLIQELAEDRSAKILPLNHRNVNKKAAIVISENDSKRDTVVADTENDGGTQCDNQSACGRKKTIKQMLVTTV
nr:BMA-APR-1, isoform b [Brugia malayi]